MQVVLRNPRTFKATQWFKMGDHPANYQWYDRSRIISEEPFTLEPIVESRQQVIITNYFSGGTPSEHVHVNSGDWIIELDGQVVNVLSTEAFTAKYIILEDQV